MERAKNTSYTIASKNYFVQRAAAAAQMTELHKRLIAAGARWDGADGYDVTQLPHAE